MRWILPALVAVETGLAQSPEIFSVQRGADSQVVVRFVADPTYFTSCCGGQAWAACANRLPAPGSNLPWRIGSLAEGGELQVVAGL